MGNRRESSSLSFCAKKKEATASFFYFWRDEKRGSEFSSEEPKIQEKGAVHLSITRGESLLLRQKKEAMASFFYFYYIYVFVFVLLDFLLQIKSTKNYLRFAAILYSCKQNKSLHSFECRLLFGAEGGIRTHAPFRTNGFQDRLVMTTSIPLHNCSIILSYTKRIVKHYFSNKSKK